MASIEKKEKRKIRSKSCKTAENNFEQHSTCKKHSTEKERHCAQ